MMRHLLTFSFLFLSCLCFAQESKEPFRKANTVIIQINDVPQDAYKKIASILATNNYGIEYSDSELLTLRTDPKAHNKGKVKINVSVIDNEIRLTSSYFTFLFPDSYIPVMYKGDKNDGNGIAWKEMMKIADAYKGEAVVYAAY